MREEGGGQIHSAKKLTGYLWAGVAISVLLVAGAVAGLDLGAVAKGFGAMNYWWLLPVFAFNFLNLALKCLRWRYFLEPVKRVSFYNATASVVISNFANVTLMSRLGTVVRAWFIGSKESISKSAALGAVVSEHIIDGIFLALLAAAALLLAGPMVATSEYFSEAALTIAILMTVSVTALSLLFYAASGSGSFFAEKLGNRVLGLLPLSVADKARRMAQSFRDGLAVLRSGRIMAPIMAISVVWWLLSGCVNMFFFYSAGLFSLPLAASFFLFFAQIAGASLPSSPGLVGPYHAAAAMGLIFFGVEKEMAVSVAIVMHAVMLISNLLPGIIFIAMEKVTFKQLRKAADY
jgi:uncharacterized protein (TIRG00374 family)